VIYFRKFVIIVISVFFGIISDDFQAYGTFLALLGFYILHRHNMPYLEERNNHLESFSLLVSLALTYIGMFFLSGMTIMI